MGVVVDEVEVVLLVLLSCPRELNWALNKKGFVVVVVVVVPSRSLKESNNEMELVGG